MVVPEPCAMWCMDPFGHMARHCMGRVTDYFSSSVDRMWIEVPFPASNDNTQPTRMSKVSRTEKQGRDKGIQGNLVHIKGN